MAETNGDIILEIAQPVGLIACRKCGQTMDVADLPIFQVVYCPVCRAGQKVPAQLKHFLLLDVLGRGGMAVVYRALDRTLERQVAIKVMKGALERDGTYVANFIREARTVAQVSHPNIVQIYMVDEVAGHPFIVMELLDGGRLDEMIAAGRPLGEEFVLRTGLQVAEGLSAAADRGLIHSDIKPANILFDRNGMAKIADFGLARFQQKPSARGEVWGTPYYIAPEKVRERREDLRSDIYSLGATLFHALALTPPFEGETATDVVLARLRHAAPKLTKFRNDLHLATIQVIGRMLEADPQFRYPNYTSLISDLHAAIESRRRGPPSTATTQPIRRPPTGLWIGIGVAAALLLLLAIWALFDQEPATPPSAAPSPSASPSPTSAPPPVASTPLQPFAPKEAQQIAKAFDALATGNTSAYEQHLVEMARSLPTNHAGRAWIALFLAVPPWTEGRLPEVQRRLSKLMQLRFVQQADGSAHPSALPQSLGRLLLEQPYIPPSASRPLPEWYDPLRRFFLIRGALSDGKINEALEHLDAYLALPESAPSWTRGFQPLARSFRQRIADWQKESEGFAEQARVGESERILQSLREREKDPAWVWFHSNIRQKIAAIEQQSQEAKRADEERRRREEEARRKAEEETRRREEEAELARIAEFRATVATLFAARNFRGAAEAVRSLRDQMKTTGGREATRFWTDACSAAEGLLDHLAARIKAAPYRSTAARRDFGGDVIAVSGNGVLVLLPTGAGTVEKAWRTIPAAAFFEMARSYLPAEGDPQRARLTLALAIYAWAVPELRPAAASLAAAAIKAEPALEAQFKAHLPALLPP